MLRKQKEKEEQSLMEKLLVDNPDKAREEYIKNWAKNVGDEYNASYNQFLKSIENPALDE